MRTWTERLSEPERTELLAILATAAAARLGLTIIMLEAFLEHDSRDRIDADAEELRQETHARAQWAITIGGAATPVPFERCRRGS
jgi:hypothetical protein